MRYAILLLALLISSVYADEWYLGVWKVTDAKFPGISAMGIGEAKSWFGSEGIYTKGKVTFRDETCDNPKYRIETLTEDGFYSSYRATFQELGIEGKSVEILEVGCPSDWVAAGSTIIRANRKFGYTLWDGVFFKIEKIAP